MKKLSKTAFITAVAIIFVACSSGSSSEATPESNPEPIRADISDVFFTEVDNASNNSLVVYSWDSDANGSPDEYYLDVDSSKDGPTSSDIVIDYQIGIS